LIIANHQSALDPPMIVLAVERQIYYLTRRTLFRPALFGKLIFSLGAIPIDQHRGGADGIRNALEVINAGYGVVIYPEGRRTPDGEIGPLQKGVLLLIRRAGVPVVPVGIAGAFEAWPIHQRWPRLGPIILPANGNNVAAVVGKPLDGKALAAMEPDAALAVLSQELHQVRAAAEKLRRRPCIAAGSLNFARSLGCPRGPSGAAALPGPPGDAPARGANL
jgi:1-acyl-sn-glycerol-3-phosphate acyltransferase